MVHKQLKAERDACGRRHYIEKFSGKFLNYRTNGGKSCPKFSGTSIFLRKFNVEIGGWQDEDLLS